MSNPTNTVSVKTEMPDTPEGIAIHAANNIQKLFDLRTILKGGGNPQSEIDGVNAALRSWGMDDRLAVLAQCYLIQHAAVMVKPEVSGWMPIEAAPKDGTTVLLSDGKDVAVGSWHDTSYETEELIAKGPKRTIYKTVTHEDGYWDNVAEFLGLPTHWMPLPAAPQAAQAHAEGV